MKIMKKNCKNIKQVSKKEKIKEDLINILVNNEKKYYLYNKIIKQINCLKEEFKFTRALNNILKV